VEQAADAYQIRQASVGDSLLVAEGCGMTELAASYALCRQIARQSASNFAWTFWLLPTQKRLAMDALYAFSRKTDDIGDTMTPAAERLAAIDAWRSSFLRAFEGTFDHPLFPAVVDTVQRFQIPREHLVALIDGVAMDCTVTESPTPRFATFAELENYCEHVASAVGLACIHIWGFRDQRALEPARQCGVAFQLTNILRDLKEDVEQQRYYLPQEDFERFDYSLQELRDGVRDARFRKLMQFEIARAEAFYRGAAPLEALLVDPSARRLFGAMLNTYRGLLEKIKRLDGDVFAERVHLSRWQKLRIAGRSLLFPRRGAAS
jgi:phytoene synthase